jgi:Zn-dependent M28 family amino/carboxypeptidase
VPLAALVANVNVDGLAFHDTFEDVIGIGAELSDLGSMLRRAVRRLELDVSEPPDEMWTAEAYGRSDQMAFAETGVPAILVNEGFAWTGSSARDSVSQSLEWFQSRYHTPADDLQQRLDFAAARLHCQVILSLVLEVANAPTAPEWRPGVPYAYQRLVSLAEGR